eukprot:3408663-Prymnesium_polylepis.1
MPKQISELGIHIRFAFMLRSYSGRQTDHSERGTLNQKQIMAIYPRSSDSVVRGRICDGGARLSWSY